MNTVSPHVVFSKLFTPVELAYLAGIVDGEETIGIAMRKGTARTNYRALFEPRLQIANTDQKLIDWIRARFGGTLVRTPAKPPHQELLTLRWIGQTARFLLKALEPYLVIKAERAALVIDAWSHDLGYIGNKAPIPDEVWQERERAYLRLRAMNAITSHRPGTKSPLFGTRKVVI